MKQSFTLENDLAMILDLLSEMVESKNLTEKQLEQIMEKIFHRYTPSRPTLQPGKNIVSNLMNYSRALDVMKLQNRNPVHLIRN